MRPVQIFGDESMTGGACNYVVATRGIDVATGLSEPDRLCQSAIIGSWSGLRR